MSDVAGFDARSSSAQVEATGVPLLAETVHAEDRVTVVVRGELDIASAPALASRLRELMCRPIGSLTVNMAGIAFMDSSGLRALNACRDDAERRGIGFSLEAVSPEVQRVLELTTMTDVFRWTPRA
jgi:anti-sigma B factor antagonist